jgi:hypothetical protein
MKKMKKGNTHYEILMVTGSRFSQREFCSRDERDEARKLSPSEQLEKACWDGLLHELFPEILGSHSIRNESFIWHTLLGKRYLYIQIGPNPASVSGQTTIDPYFYMITVSDN